MCGIAGILLAQGHKQNVQTIRELFTANLLANEVRGKEATGVLIVQSDGSYLLKKDALSASEFVKSSAYQAALAAVGPETVLLLGHTRKPTKGSPRDNNNNHPIIRGRTIGVHNGTLSNDDEIFQKHLKSGPESRIGAVDSEAIFALIDELPHGLPMTEKGSAITGISSFLHGSYTTLYCHPDTPSLLYLLKYNNPMSVHYAPEFQGLFFSSRYIFLRKTFGRSVITEALPSRHGYIFDARSIPERGKRPSLSFPLVKQEDMLH
jgi:glucosamine 6-phosphate synthetase-like amidotransferase/phosphosugar isomerase protein